MGSATRDLFASWFPRLFAPLVRYGIYAMLDEPMLAAFGFPRPFGFMPPLARLALKMRGTQKGEFMGTPASGKKIEVKGFDIVRFVEGKAVEHWGLSDDYTMLQQLGVIPAPEAKQ